MFSWFYQNIMKVLTQVCYDYHMDFQSYWLQNVSWFQRCYNVKKMHLQND